MQSFLTWQVETENQPGCYEGILLSVKMTLSLMFICDEHLHAKYAREMKSIVNRESACVGLNCIMIICISSVALTQGIITIMALLRQ